MEALQDHSNALRTVKDFASRNAQAGLYFSTQAQIRWALFNGETNGLIKSEAIVRYGSGLKKPRVLIDEQKWWAWVRGNGNGNGTRC